MHINKTATEYIHGKDDCLSQVTFVHRNKQVNRWKTRFTPQTNKRGDCPKNNQTGAGEGRGENVLTQAKHRSFNRSGVGYVMILAFLNL